MTDFLQGGYDRPDSPFTPDVRSVILPQDGSVPYLYIFLLTSSLISAGITLGKILTKGKNPVMKKVPSFKFAKACIMFLSKFIVQGYILCISITCLLFKFMSKVLSKILNF